MHLRDGRLLLDLSIGVRATWHVSGRLDEVHILKDLRVLIPGRLFTFNEWDIWVFSNL